MDNTKLRNYAFDTYNFDTGTLHGQASYFEWLEEVVLDENKYKELKRDLKEY